MALHYDLTFKLHLPIPAPEHLNTVGENHTTVITSLKSPTALSSVQQSLHFPGGFVLPFPTEFSLIFCFL